MAEKIVIQVQADTTQAVKGIDKIDESVQDVNESTDDLTNSLDKMTGGAVSGFKGIAKSVGTAVKGFRSLKIAIAATGIGLLVLAIGALTTSFTASEEGQNRFTRLMTQIGVVVGNVTDIIANLGEGIFAAGKALIKLAKGDLKGASAAWGELKTNVSEVTEGIKNFGEETKKEIKLAGELADARAKADKAERKLIVDRAEADRKRAELLEQAVDKEQFSTEQRIGFLEEAGRIEEQITNQEIAAAKLRLQAKEQENSLSKSTKEDLLEEAELKAQVIQLETAKLAKQKEVTSQTIALKAEQAAAEKAIQAEKDAAEKLRKDTIAKEDKEREETQLKEKQERDARIVAGQQQTDAMLTQSKAQAVDAAISLFGAETAAGKAALIAKQLLAAEEMISEARKTITFSSLVAARSTAAVAEGTAQTAKIGFPQNIPMLIGYALQAVGIIGAISSAVGKSKSVASSLGGGGGSTPSITRPSAPTSAPPAFNIVGAGAGNQLAETIAGQNERPIKAFVTSQDVTTAQSLERNIVEGASI
jgi:chemotaxis protein histidine kinase CheA